MVEYGPLRDKCPCRLVSLLLLVRHLRLKQGRGGGLFALQVKEPIMPELVNKMLRDDGKVDLSLRKFCAAAALRYLGVVDYFSVCSPPLLGHSRPPLPLNIIVIQFQWEQWRIAVEVLHKIELHIVFEEVFHHLNKAEGKLELEQPVLVDILHQPCQRLEPLLGH